MGPMVTGGLAAHPFAAARDVLRFYRDFTASLPDELTAFAGLLHAPDGSGTKLAAIVVCRLPGAWRPARRRRGARQALRLAGHGRDRTDAVPCGEHDVRRRLPSGRPELLEVELPRRRCATTRSTR